MLLNFCRNVVHAEMEEVGISVTAVTQRPAGPSADLPVQTQPETRSGSRELVHITCPIAEKQRDSKERKAKFCIDGCPLLIMEIDNFISCARVLIK